MSAPNEMGYDDASIPSVGMMDMEDAAEIVKTKTDIGPGKSFPEPILRLYPDSEKNDKAIEKFTQWIDNKLEELIREQSPVLTEWANQEVAYRARSLGPRSFPFEGACGDVVPLISMAVDPIYARLDVGLFKSDRVIKIKALRKKMVDKVEALETWFDFYYRHYAKLREVMQPRLLEFVKHGTMVLKTVYDDDSFKVQTYDDQWNVVEKTITRFKGPRPIGIPLQDFLFSPRYQNVQQCPIIAERQRVTLTDLYVAQAIGKLTNVDKLEGQEILDTSVVDSEREIAVDHKKASLDPDKVTIYELWCDYDINGDNLPERLVATYHKDTRTLLQLRYNWYFHQRKPYTVIAYQG